MFLHPVVAFVEEIPSVQKPGFSAIVKGKVRKLVMLDSGFSVLWRKISGPGYVSFGNKTSLETHVFFDVPGKYQLRVDVSSDGISEFATLLVEVA